MKCFPFLLFLTVLGAAQTPGPRSVYILPMAGGFDQYLAGQIVRGHAMQVVADPKAADAVLTDRLGEAFEMNFAKIRPPAADAGKDTSRDESTGHVFQSNRAAGTIFLVDAASRRVLWSDYQKTSRSPGAAALNREAAKVAKKLAEFVSPSAGKQP
jgi:hypothetical protein